MDDRGQPVAGIVLAAGSSTRMGRNKLFLVLEGKTVLRRSVTTALAAGLEPVIVVSGHERQRLEEGLLGLPCRPTHNADHAEGIHTSARVGVEAVPDANPAAIIMLADMPLVSAEMLRTLVRRYRVGDAPLVISEYGDGINAPPMLYDRSLFGELKAMERRCGKEVVERHREEAEVVSWPKRALSDLDTPEDLDRVRKALERGPDPVERESEAGKRGTDAGRRAADPGIGGSGARDDQVTR